MSYATYNNPGEFFNIAPTTSALTVASESITLGCGDHTTPENRFLTHLTEAQANLTTGSTAQTVFGIVDAIYQRFNTIPSASKPSKFNITRSGFTDETTGELVYNYSVRCRVAPGSLVAVNS